MLWGRVGVMGDGSRLNQSGAQGQAVARGSGQGDKDKQWLEGAVRGTRTSSG